MTKGARVSVTGRGQGHVVSWVNATRWKPARVLVHFDTGGRAWINPTQIERSDAHAARSS